LLFAVSILQRPPGTPATNLFEEEAIDQYKKLIKMCDQIDLVTQDLILEITAQEQAHRRQFIGFLYEYERGEAKRLTAAA